MEVKIGDSLAGQAQYNPAPQRIQSISLRRIYDEDVSLLVRYWDSSFPPANIILIRLLSYNPPKPFPFRQFTDCPAMARILGIKILYRSRQIHGLFVLNPDMEETP